MTYGRMLNQYQKTKVKTAGKMDMVILCYEKTIQFLVQARNAYEDGEFEKKAKAFKKAMDIIEELNGSLDFEKGGQIAKNLDAIYNYLQRRLLEGDVNKDLTAFDEAIRIMGELKEAWEAIGSESTDRQGDATTVPDSTTMAAAQIAL
jgi:flagellar protein FliS